MTTQQTTKWRALIGLIILYIAMWYDWQWIWGILFLMWVIPDIFSGITYFIEPVDKENHPLLYWAIIVSWILLRIASFLYAIFPEWRQY